MFASGTDQQVLSCSLVRSKTDPSLRHCGRDVFIVGAGFSKAVDEYMPLLGELTALLGDGLPADLLASVPFLRKDFELGLTYLAEGHPGLSEPQRLRNRALLLDITQQLTETLVARTEKAKESSNCPWLLSLAYFLHERRAVVITLNYDTLLEWALGRIIVGGGRLLDVRAVRGLELQSETGCLGVSEMPTALLLKLHGSTDWYYSGSESYYGEPIYDRPLPGKAPLILPPVASKNLYFNNELLRGQWSLAARSLARAERILCLGYSLPVTDLTFRFLLQTSGENHEERRQPSERVPFYVVDRDPSRIQHYRAHLPAWLNPCDEFCGGDDCIQRLVAALENEMVAFTPELEWAPSGDAYCLGAAKAAIAPGSELQIMTRQQQARSIIVHSYDQHGMVVRDAEDILCRVPWRCFDFAYQTIAAEDHDGRPVHSPVDDVDHALAEYYPARQVCDVVLSILEKLGRIRRFEQYGAAYVEVNRPPGPAGAWTHMGS